MRQTSKDWDLSFEWNLTFDLQLAWYLSYWAVVNIIAYESLIVLYSTI